MAPVAARTGCPGPGGRHTGAMPDAAAIPTAAVLSALADQVEGMVGRVGDGASAADGAPTEALAAALFDAERSLRSAHRALVRAGRLVP